MSGPRLNALRKQFDELKQGIDNINRAASDAGRDLTDSEQADLDKLFDRAEQIKPEIEAEAEREQSLTAVADVLARVGGGEPTSINRATRPTEAPEMSAGDYFTEFFRAYHPDGGSAPEEFLDRAARYFDRAATTSADVAGVLPEPIVGPLIKFNDSRRPVFTSFASRSMPAKGKTFERPRITQRVTVGTQAAEGDGLSSQALTIGSETVTKATQGGTLDLSHQHIDWSEPSALQTVVQDFVDMYAEWTEGLACDVLETAHATNTSAYDDTDVGTLVDSYVDAVVAVYNAAKRFPDTIWLDLASWATLTKTTNTNNDRTALSMINEALGQLNGGGLNSGGMRWVVGPQLAADTRTVGVSDLIESYEQQKGLLRAEMPSTLQVQLAYAGYTAFYKRAEGFVSIEGA